MVTPHAVQSKLLTVSRNTDRLRYHLRFTNLQQENPPNPTRFFVLLIKCNSPAHKIKHFRTPHSANRHILAPLTSSLNLRASLQFRTWSESSSSSDRPFKLSEAWAEIKGRRHHKKHFLLIFYQKKWAQFYWENFQLKITAMLQSGFTRMGLNREVSVVSG